jgi:hypothetical protein
VAWACLPWADGGMNGNKQKGVVWVLLQKSKSAIFDGCNPLKYRDTIFDKSVKNQFLQQNHIFWLDAIEIFSWLFGMTVIGS